MQLTPTTSTSQPPLPPGQFGLPVIGETPKFISDPDFFNKRRAQYGDIFRTHLLGHPTVVMMGPEANRFVLASHMDHFSWREGWPKTFHTLLGESLFLQEGEQHRRNRKLLMPAFHGRALSAYFDTMVSITQRYLESWQQQESLNGFSAMKQLTFEIASTLLIGSQPGTLTAQLSSWFSDLTDGLFSLPLRLPLTPYSKALRARTHLLEHIQQVVKERMAHPTDDALGLLVQSRDENGDRLSLKELKAQALLMLFAGHETTTSMLTSLLVALAQHPKILKTCRLEQDALAIAGDLSLEQLQQMPYLEQVLKEVERLYPPVGGGFRGVVKPFEFNGYRVPAGWKALYQMRGSQHDPRCFPQPQQFDPDRFGPDRAEYKRTDYSLVGFGGGPRVCIGFAFAQMEMKIVAALLLRHYQWELIPDQDLFLSRVPTLRPRSGAQLRLAQRPASPI